MNTPGAMPTHDELFNPTLKALRKLGGSASIEELTKAVIEELKASAEVIQRPHGRGSTTELEYRLAWARTYLKKYGLLDNSERGVWSLTPKGVDVGAIDPKAVVQFVVQSLRATEPSPPSTKKGDRAKNLVEAVEVEDARDETASWRAELLETLLNMPPAAFERLAQRLLRESGFIEVDVTGRSGDGGIDGRGVVRVAGLISFNVVFQCKRHRDNVGPNIVREFRGAMVGKADKGLLITTGGFTREAKLEATRDGAPPIDLIGGDQLVEKLRELKLGVRSRTVEVVDVNKEWFSTIMNGKENGFPHPLP